MLGDTQVQFVPPGHEPVWLTSGCDEGNADSV